MQGAAMPVEKSCHFWVRIVGEDMNTCSNPAERYRHMPPTHRINTLGLDEELMLPFHTADTPERCYVISHV